MPVYNVEQYISTAIESVLNQDYYDWELLIVDDGTLDNSIEIANQYADKDSRIRVLRKENGGLSDARNFGLEHACGEFVHFFDSDDFISPSFYSNVISSFSPQDDFVICGYYKDIESNNHVISKEMRCVDIHSFNIDPNISYRELFVSHFNYAWNKIFRFKFLINNNLRYKKGLSIIEDKEFMSRVLKCKPQFKFVNYLGYHYLVRKRFTLNNNVTDDFVECNTRGIVLQKEILSYFCKNRELLDHDGAIIAFDGIRWTINCLFNTSSCQTLKKKKENIDYILTRNAIQEQLSFLKTRGLKDSFYKYLLQHKMSYVICLIHKLSKIINK